MVYRSLLRNILSNTLHIHDVRDIGLISPFLPGLGTGIMTAYFQGVGSFLVAHMRLHRRSMGFPRSDARRLMTSYVMPSRPGAVDFLGFRASCISRSVKGIWSAAPFACSAAWITACLSLLRLRKADRTCSGNSS